MFLGKSLGLPDDLGRTYFRYLITIHTFHYNSNICTIGEDVVFIVLNMTKECQTKRLEARHHGTGLSVDFMERMHKLYEPAGCDEKGAYNLTVTENMTQDDVIDEVQKIVGNLV